MSCGSLSEIATSADPGDPTVYCDCASRLTDTEPSNSTVESSTVGTVTFAVPPDRSKLTVCDPNSDASTSPKIFVTE